MGWRLMKHLSVETNMASVDIALVHGVPCHKWLALLLFCSNNGWVNYWLQHASEQFQRPKLSSKKSGDSELNWGHCLQAVLCKGSHCTVSTATRARINEWKRKGPRFKSQRVQSFLSEEKNAKNWENITVGSGEKDSLLGKRWTGKTKGLDLCRALEHQINSS